MSEPIGQLLQREPLSSKDNPRCRHSNRRGEGIESDAYAIIAGSFRGVWDNSAGEVCGEKPFIKKGNAVSLWRHIAEFPLFLSVELKTLPASCYTGTQF